MLGQCFRPKAKNTTQCYTVTPNYYSCTFHVLFNSSKVNDPCVVIQWDRPVITDGCYCCHRLLMSVDYLCLSRLYKWKPAALKSYRDTTHSHSCQAEHAGHGNTSIAANKPSAQHTHTHTWPWNSHTGPGER